MGRVRLLLVLMIIGTGGALAMSPGCMTDPVTGKKSLGIIDYSDEEEVAEGRKYARSFVSEYDGAYPDAEVSDYLTGIVRRLGALSHRPELPYRFTLLNSSVPNAFALPGGEVFMTRGLLTRLDEEAMFAVVMGHEIGHVNHRHSVKAMNNSLLVGLAGTVLAGSLKEERDAEMAAGLASKGGELLLLRFSRDQELQSDERGVEYAYEAGYDPRRGVKVFEEFARMKAASGQAEGPFASWTSSHPLDEDRIAYLLKMVGERYPSLKGGAPATNLVVTTPAYGRLLARVREAQVAYDKLDIGRAAAAKALKKGDGNAAQRALRTIEEAGRSQPKHALFPAVEGALLTALGDRRRARERLERAVALQPDLYFARMSLAELDLQEGRGRAAVEQASTAVRIDPSSGRAYLTLARSFESSGDKDRATRAYEQAAILARTDASTQKAAKSRLAVLDPERYGEKSEDASEDKGGGKSRRKRNR